MNSVLRERRNVNGRAMLAEAMAAGEAALRQAMAGRLTALLVAAVTHLLARGYHVRRKEVPVWEEQEGVCQRCGSHESRRFSRNGSRPRTWLSGLGEIRFGLPRVKCVCGGSVRLPLAGLLQPYQRISGEVDAQIQRWHALGLSLRQMAGELAHSYVGPLGLNTLLDRLHRLAEAGGWVADAVPPVVQVDAIWITQLRPTGEVRRDRRGRRRLVKGRHKRPVFIAMGVWPEEGRSQILAWQVGESEEAEAWEGFLSQLEAAGIRGEAGLEVVIHDGGSGLCSALQTVHFGALTQRCLFHKLRNIARDIVVADEEQLSRLERRRRRKAILRQFQHIWQAKQRGTALRRYLQVVRALRRTQPKAVATLRRDFRATLAYYDLLERHPHWDPKHLRTTSRLERFNRRLRRRAHHAAAYHSDSGLHAMLAQEAAAHNTPPA